MTKKLTKTDLKYFSPRNGTTKQQDTNYSSQHFGRWIMIDLS